MITSRFMRTARVWKNTSALMGTLTIIISHYGNTDSLYTSSMRTLVVSMIISNSMWTLTAFVIISYSTLLSHYQPVCNRVPLFNWLLISISCLSLFNYLLVSISFHEVLVYQELKTLLVLKLWMKITDSLFDIGTLTVSMTKEPRNPDSLWQRNQGNLTVSMTKEPRNPDREPRNPDSLYDKGTLTVSM
jgi:hypothetical protein